MGKRILLMLSGILVLQLTWADQNLAEALKQTPAPNQEFIRTQAKYIFKKLSETATRSGNLSLASFTIDTELEGCGEVKVSINLANMNLFDAILAVAKATGAGADFQTNRVVLKDPSEVEMIVFEAPPEPEQEPKVKTKEVRPDISFSDISHSLVFVENGGGRGSGFIAEMGGKIYVFSNQHNFLSAKKVRLRTMDNTYLKPKSFEYSRTHDLVRMRLDPKDIDGLVPLKLSFSTPMIHDEILIYGNSAGGGVATELDGEVLGVGPMNIEITAKIVPGNSGSPIMNDRAEVIGVATYATLGQNFEKGSVYEKSFKNTRFNKVRRFGIRIPESNWTSDSLSAYLRQTYQLEDMKTYLLATYALHQYWIGNSEYNTVVNRMFLAYSGISSKIDPPFDFKMKATEEKLRQVVRSFKMNHEDLKSSDRQVFESTQVDGANRLKRILTAGVSDIKVSVNKTRWKSNLLKTEARTISEIADEVTSQIEGTENPYSTQKRRRR